VTVEPADGIRRLGFRRWYERQLMDGFASLVTAVLCAILLAVCIEQIDFRGTIAPLFLMLLITFVAGAVAFVTTRRFLMLLARAELYGDRSTCANCQVYGRLEVLSSQGPSLQVRCRNCQHEWRMP
jgi:hypothetical protein